MLQHTIATIYGPDIGGIVMYYRTCAHVQDMIDEITRQFDTLRCHIHYTDVGATWNHCETDDDNYTTVNFTLSDKMFFPILHMVTNVGCRDAYLYCCHAVSWKEHIFAITYPEDGAVDVY